LRLDKWLWQARFFKSRSIASEVIAEGHVRVNGTRISRPGRDIAQGDTLTFPQGHRIRVVRVLALGQRRGPASEAQALYNDLDPAPPEPDMPVLPDRLE
jgi:ribosome-associated heat shock protein Hsp15